MPTQTSFRSSGTFQRPPLTTNVIIAIVLMVIAFIAMIVVEPLKTFVNQYLLLTPNTASNLQLWAPLSHVLWPQNAMMIIFDSLMLYFFASDAEERFGAFKWWWTVILSALVGGILAMLIMWPLSSFAFMAKALPLGGFAAPVAAFIAIYCYRFWNQTLNLFSVEIQGKMMLGLILIIDVIFSLLSMHPGNLALRLGGYAVGLAMASGTLFPTDLYKKFQYWRIKRRLKVVARTPESDKKDKSRRLDDGTWIN